MVIESYLYIVLLNYKKVYSKESNYKVAEIRELVLLILYIYCALQMSPISYGNVQEQYKYKMRPDASTEFN